MDDGRAGSLRRGCRGKVEGLGLVFGSRGHSQHAGKAVPLVVRKIYPRLPAGRRRYCRMPDVIEGTTSCRIFLLRGLRPNPRGDGDHAWECVGQHFAAGAGKMTALFEV